MYVLTKEKRNNRKYLFLDYKVQNEELLELLYDILEVQPNLT